MLPFIAGTGLDVPDEIRRWKTLIRDCLSIAPGASGSVLWSDAARTIMHVQSHCHAPPAAVPGLTADTIIVRAHRSLVGSGIGCLRPIVPAWQASNLPSISLTKAELVLAQAQAAPEPWERVKEHIGAHRPELESLLRQSLLLLDVALQSSRLMMVLEMLPTPAMLLDEDAVLQLCNSAARNLLIAKQHVSLSPTHQLTLPDSLKTRELRSIVKSLAIEEPQTEGPAFLRYQSEGIDQSNYLRLSPVLTSASATEDNPRLLSRSVKVEFHIANEANKISTEGIQKLFGITTSEARLAEAMCQGLTVDAYAEREGLAVSTVRWHLHNLLARTETRGQTELIRLLLTILK
jgi:DNA-binding CsgD family transcriptional regulator